MSSVITGGNTIMQKTLEVLPQSSVLSSEQKGQRAFVSMEDGVNNYCKNVKCFFEGLILSGKGYLLW